MRRTWKLSLILLVPMASIRGASAEPPLVEKYLHSGDFKGGETALIAALETTPGDDQLRFGLGTLQFIRSIEHLGQSLYRYGIRSDRGQRLNMPILRLPIPLNPKAEELDYPATRRFVQVFINDLERAEKTFSLVRDEKVKLPLRVGSIHLDLTGSGKAKESLRDIVTRYMGNDRNMPKDNDLRIAFDRGDVAWFRGYCHLLMALCEIALAYDGQEIFDSTAHLFVTKPKSPYTFLKTSNVGHSFWDVGDGVDIIDVIAMIHLVRLPVAEPARGKVALAHLQKVMELSRESWKYILAETDDEDEWIPNTHQKGALGIKLEQSMIDSWLEFVNESEALLEGKRLVPFWRGDDPRGINLRRVFTEPRPLDVVLWVQGSAAAPYLEKGTMTKPEVWSRLLRVFQGEFIGFALWFN